MTGQDIISIVFKAMENGDVLCFALRGGIREWVKPTHLVIPSLHSPTTVSNSLLNEMRKEPGADFSYRSSGTVFEIRGDVGTTSELERKGAELTLAADEVSAITAFASK